MKMKFLAYCIGFLSASAFADTYIQADVLYGTTHTNTTNRTLYNGIKLADEQRENNEMSYRVSVGKSFGNLRSDLFVLNGVPTKSGTITYSATHEEPVERSYYAAGLSGYYDFKNTIIPALTPYVGASIMSVTYSLDDQKGDTLAYELKAGLQYQFKPNLAIDIGVNHYQTDKLDYGKSDDFFINKYSHTKPQLGLRYYY